MTVKNLSKIIDYSGRTTRLVLTILMLPVMMFGPRAFLIHDHQGHDIHSHTLTTCEMGMWSRESEHVHSEHLHNEHQHREDHHSEHQHGNSPGYNLQNDDELFTIVMGLPEALIVLRGSVTFNIVIAGHTSSIATNIAMPVVTEHGSTLSTLGTSFAPSLRAGNRITQILLTNHTLLI